MAKESKKTPAKSKAAPAAGATKVPAVLLDDGDLGKKGAVVMEVDAGDLEGLEAAGKARRATEKDLELAGLFAKAE